MGEIKNIGLVSTWLHRGATYVTINYAKLFQPKMNVFVFGRGGEYFDETLIVDGVNVHKGARIDSKDGVNPKEIVKWISDNHIDVVIWNEQRDVTAICYAKKVVPSVMHGAYIDYYREDTVESFGVYDFLICNTKRHYSVFSWYPQCFYIPWGCDTSLYAPKKREYDGNKIVFFHSMGMSNRKGTNVLVKTFIANNLGASGAKLVIHTQINIDSIIAKEEAEKYNIEIIEKTVAAPGLYHLGDVYVYPAKLDGLGLTLYEAISCGLPVIATDAEPMNEVINESNGRLVKVKKTYSRSDGYYWPLSEIDEESLFLAMKYYIDRADSLPEISKSVRNDAVNNWELSLRKVNLENMLKSVKSLDNRTACEQYLAAKKASEKREKRVAFTHLFVPQKVFSLFKEWQVNRKYKNKKAENR
ncbi:MAG: glycosyltransferase [Suipraeoptans sp.]